MDMRICITAGHGGRPLEVEVFGLSLSLTGLSPECPVTVSEAGGGLKVSIGTAEAQKAAAPEPDYVSELPTAKAEPEPPAPTEGSGQELFEKLSALRKKVATETGVPPYVVFHDNTLMEMCRVLPADLTALSSIQGVGKAKLDKYGEIFTAAVREHTGAA